MSIITLTTDFGLKDYYVAALKGNIITQFDQARIIDISHDIRKNNIVEAAFVLRNSFFEFPKGSIHIIGVDSAISDKACHVVIEYKEHFFIGSDNGIFSLLFDSPPTRIAELSVRSDGEAQTFPAKDSFAKAACHLARGGTMEVISKPLQGLQPRETYNLIREGNTLKGTVVYIDSYGNAITNIHKSIFDSMGRGRDYQISTKVSGYNMNSIKKRYNEVTPGERLSVFGSNGYLEIAMNVGEAGKLMGFKFGDSVKIEFLDS